MPKSVEESVTLEIVSVLGQARGSMAGRSLDMFADGYLDSFAVVELTARIEVKFGVAIPVEEINIDNFCSVTALAQMLGRLGVV